MNNENKIEQSSTTRRKFLQGAAAVGVGASLAPYLGRAGVVGATTVPAGGDAANPFGIAEDSTVDAVIFDGGYGTDYVTFAADIFEQVHEGSSVEVSPSTQIATELQPRFVGGNPPDLVDNSGAQAIGLNTILDQLEDLTDVIDAPNLEGVTIRDTLFGGVLSPGTFGGKLAAINYAFTVYGVWYSGSLFEENGWTPPTNWAEALELGAAAKEAGKYLFCWGKEASSYYRTMCLESAIKEGGDEVRLALENLAEGAWSQPAVQAAFTGLKAIIDAGYMQPGGGGTQFTQAQAQWSLAQDAIMYPSGSWIENEMKEQTAENFQMKGVPTWAVTADSVMPASALRATAGEPFIVPSQGANVAGGKELLRIMLSKDAATNFAKTKLAPTIVAGLVPEDGFGSTALVSQSEMLAAAGDDIFNIIFYDFYGTTQDELPIWNTFLAGDMSVEDLTAQSQEITDAKREDDSITKISVE
jgi:N-acetylglucosamine transport system substrate-binding protein